jgi:hypothetical protein
MRLVRAEGIAVFRNCHFPAGKMAGSDGFLLFLHSFIVRAKILREKSKENNNHYAQNSKTQ